MNACVRQPDGAVPRPLPGTRQGSGHYTQPSAMTKLQKTLDTTLTGEDEYGVIDQDGCAV